MPENLLEIQRIFKAFIKQIFFITLISTLISVFYVASKPITKSYNAHILFEVGSLNHSFIDGVNTLSALALSYDFDNILIVKAYNHGHYLIFSSIEDTSEDAKKNLENFVNLILKRHNKMIDKRVNEVSKNINLLTEQINLLTEHLTLNKSSSGLLLKLIEQEEKLIEQEELINSLSKSAILKGYEVEEKNNKPNQVLVALIGLIIGLMISLFLILFQYTFYSDRKI